MEITIEHSVEHHCTIYLVLKFAISFCNDPFVSGRTCCYQCVVTSDPIVPKLRQLITCTDSCVCLLYSFPPPFFALLFLLFSSPLPFPPSRPPPLDICCPLSSSFLLLSSPRIWLCTFQCRADGTYRAGTYCSQQDFTGCRRTNGTQHLC